MYFFYIYCILNSEHWAPAIPCVLYSLCGETRDRGDHRIEKLLTCCQGNAFVTKIRFADTGYNRWAISSRFLLAFIVVTLQLNHLCEVVASSNPAWALEVPGNCVCVVNIPPGKLKQINCPYAKKRAHEGRRRNLYTQCYLTEADRRQLLCKLSSICHCQYWPSIQICFLQSPCMNPSSW